MLRKTLVAGAVALSLFGIVPTMAQATVITFDSLANNGRGYYYLAGPYVESGFQFSSSINSGGISFFTSGSGNTDSYAGSASLANAWGAGVTTLSSVSGAAFNLSSIELATGFKSLGTAASVTFNGHVHGGGTVTDTVTVGNTLSFSQFNFTGFKNLDSVTWTNNYPFTQLDNVTVAAVPEPETYVMMLAGLGLMGFMVRRKKTA